ncbi:MULTISPECIES: ATP-binding cassette domain-containing protein [Streptosporangium]|uniref:ABC-2 type transport system ATP-binding protein n=1 Tax=Streptosporangium brasiliense TaxID=47480 RepID=A0ABT9R2R2_9ACTN|nr:ATP-binding cassette domain-containing protein [Streptosporangium brasiliense]MDP9863519.1 ABC-2 type transport system ATP-binding protein [Streptosporangium brasiliense]
MEFVFEVEGLVQGYGSRRVISGLSMKATRGAVGLLGPNGAGKTTLLRTLATVTPPGEGTIRVFGRELRGDADVREARRAIGYLPQDFGYHPGFSVYEFVRYCAWLRMVPDRTAGKAALRALDQVGLADMRSRKMKELSGGMLRRVGIAQAIVGDVKLVLLDEPTVGLDPEQRLEFRDLIREISSEAAVVLSTHLVEDVAAACSTLHVVRDGTVVFSGTPRQLADCAAPDGRGDTPLERGYTTALRAPAVTT